jgi:hypothetical protein
VQNSIALVGRSRSIPVTIDPPANRVIELDAKQSAITIASVVFAGGTARPRWRRAGELIADLLIC